MPHPHRSKPPLVVAIASAEWADPKWWLWRWREFRNSSRGVLLTCRGQPTLSSAIGCPPTMAIVELCNALRWPFLSAAISNVTCRHSACVPDCATFGNKPAVIYSRSCPKITTNVCTTNLYGHFFNLAFNRNFQDFQRLSQKAEILPRIKPENRKKVKFLRKNTRKSSKSQNYWRKLVGRIKFLKLLAILTVKRATQRSSSFVGPLKKQTLSENFIAKIST